VASLYVYGIIDGELNVTEELHGMENEPIFSIGNSGIAAVVSVSEKRRFEVTEELLLIHERVIESLMSSHTVLPMRYGTVVLDKSEILEIIKARRESIESLIQKVREKVELGVKVLWNPEPIKQQVEHDVLEVEALRINIQQSQRGGKGARGQDGKMARWQGGKEASPSQQSSIFNIQSSIKEGQRYLMEKLYEELVQRKVKSHGEKFISHILEKLSSLSFDKVFVKFPTERLLLSASFLVKKDNVADFEMLAQQLITEYQQLSFLFTGPWPPYNFTKIQLKESGNQTFL